MIGETLRHYRIEAKIGAGGMGVVYRAFDSHLDRPAAIKVLPAAAVVNAERRARFAQEAKSASALSHRNIITIYDVDTGQIDGQPVDFIAMEFVSGKTLDKLIGRKGLRLSEALRYAIQIADGLSAAHAAGIIHRDLKPANIMVNEQGDVKILDFGLAKLSEPEQADAHAVTQSVHIDALLQTEVGTILGTVAYMSPEQADGHKVDERSDIFSFGAVLYEMVTGRRAFPGNSKLSTIASVMHKDPAPLNQSGEEVPLEVERIIMRCLRKDPQRRWQSMADLKVALEDELADWDTTKMQAGQGAAARIGHRGLPMMFWISLVVLALAGGAYIGSQFLKTPQPTFQRLTYRRGNVAGSRFSPDGQTVLFSAQWASEPIRIFSMRPGRRESSALDLPAGRILSISSSSEMAILRASTAIGAPGTLARVPLSGGAPRDILENINDADWSLDGNNLAVSHTVGNRNRIEYPIGTVLAESSGRPPINLRISPKGDMLAFFEYDNTVGDYAVTVVDLHGVKRTLSRGWTASGGLAWSPKGDEIWYCGTKIGGEPALWAVTLSEHERMVAGTPGWMTLQDVTRDGRVLLAVEDSRMGISGLTPGTKQERDFSWFDASRVYDISSDGNNLLFVELSYGDARNTAIYLRKTDGSPAIRLGEGNRPMLSPDGKWVACIFKDGLKTTLTILPTGAGESRKLPGNGFTYERAEWFPDSERLLIVGSESGKRPRTFVQDMRGKPAPITHEGVTATRVSPDQKYVTVSDDGKLNLLPIAGGAPKPIASLENGESAIAWSSDGKYLFLRKPIDSASLAILRLNVATGRKEPWRELKTADPVGVQIGVAVITPDGNSYAYSYQRDISTLYLAEGLK